MTIIGCPAPLVENTNTVTLNPIASRSVIQAEHYNESELMVMSIEYGIKSLVYIAFDLSEFSENTIPTSAVFKIKTEAISYTCWISAFCFPTADWVETGMVWDTKPGLGIYVDAVYVDTMRDWYSWESDSLIGSVLAALRVTGRLTIALKTGIGDTYQYGLVIFYPDAKLEITYTLDTNAPTYSDIEAKPSSPTPDDEVRVTITVADDISEVKEVNLHYSTDGGVNWIKVSMSPLGNSKYEATIPEQSKDTTVQYYIEAFDNALNKAKSNTISYVVRLTLLEEKPWLIIVVFGIPIIIGVLIFRYMRRRLSRTKVEVT